MLWSFEVSWADTNEHSAELQWEISSWKDLFVFSLHSVSVNKYFELKKDKYKGNCIFKNTYIHIYSEENLIAEK